MFLDYQIVYVVLFSLYVIYEAQQKRSPVQLLWNAVVRQGEMCFI